MQHEPHHPAQQGACEPRQVLECIDINAGFARLALVRAASGCDDIDDDEADYYWQYKGEEVCEGHHRRRVASSTSPVVVNNKRRQSKQRVHDDDDDDDDLQRLSNNRRHGEAVEEAVPLHRGFHLLAQGNF